MKHTFFLNQFYYPEANIGTHQFSLFVKHAVGTLKQSWKSLSLLHNLKSNMEIHNLCTRIVDSNTEIIAELKIVDLQQYKYQ